MGGSLTVEVDQTIGGRLGVTGQVFMASSLSAVFICKTWLVFISCRFRCIWGCLTSISLSGFAHMGGNCPSTREIVVDFPLGKF